ncbi:CHAT domain-containing protein [Actinacidiphila glaucinigra]|uniref:CHAT domain-containing protein n=1 Tax=Actinacidiphila glaucinigra TaxID=235986 RepID=UPI0037C63AED
MQPVQRACHVGPVPYGGQYSFHRAIVTAGQRPQIRADLVQVPAHRSQPPCRVPSLVGHKPPPPYDWFGHSPAPRPTNLTSHWIVAPKQRALCQFTPTYPVGRGRGARLRAGGRRVRDELLAAVWARLGRLAETGDPSAVMEPQALADAQRLAALLRTADKRGDSDVTAWYALGWFHWNRCSALPLGVNHTDLMAAVAAFVPCFLDGTKGLPEGVLPFVAGHAAPHAVELFQRAMTSTDLDVLSAAVHLWECVVNATPPGFPQRPVYQVCLGGALRMRFERTGDRADLDEAIVVARDALRTFPADDSQRMKCLSLLGDVLRVRFTRSGDQADLDEAVDHLRATVKAVPADDPGRAGYLSNLGIALVPRFQQTGNQADLDEAVRSLQSAVAAAPANHPDRATYLSNLGTVLRTRFGRFGDQADLGQAITVEREAADAVPTDHPRHPLYMSNLGVALMERFERTGDRADLEEAVRSLQSAVAATPDNHAERATYVSNLADALQARFERTGNQAGSDEAVVAAREALSTLPADHPDRPSYLAKVAITSMARFGRTGDRADLDEAINGLRSVVAAVPDDHRNRTGYMSNLGVALMERFERTGDRADLDEAIDGLHSVVAAVPDDHPDRAGYLSNLGTALQSRFHYAGNPVDINAAIAVEREAVAAKPADHPDQATYLSNLGVALQSRFDRAANQVDLDEAITVLRKAVDTIPDDHPNRARSLSNLGQSLRARYERTGDITDLEEAITVERKAVKATPDDHPDRKLRLSNLAVILQARFGRTGNQADLDEALRGLRTAVAATPDNHPRRRLLLSNLGRALRTRFERTGDVADLDEAITVERKAVKATPDDHPDRARHLSHLAIALQARFGRTGDRAALDEAVDHHRAAVAGTPVEHPEHAGYRSNLGTSLLSRFDRTGNPADLDEAITVQRKAMEATPDGHVIRAQHLSHLGHALLAGYKRTGDRAALDEAVDHLRAAVAATAVEQPEHAKYQCNLAVALMSRFQRTEEETDLDEAIDRLRSATAAAPDDQPERATALSNLGTALWTRSERTGNGADLGAAMAAYTEAYESATTTPTIRVKAASAVAALLATSDTGRAADAAEAAVLLLPELAARQLGRGDQQHALGQFAGLAPQAAGLALADPRTGRHERAARALRLLEAGRAVLYSQALDTRDDITELKGRHPDLAARFVRLRDQLDQPANDSPLDALTDTDTLAAHQEHSAAPDRHDLVRDLARTLSEIRALDGFGSFARPPSVEELLADATQGPVVVFNISHFRSDALVLTHDGITHLELPGITAPTLNEQITAFHQALATASTGASTALRRAAQDDMTEVLEWLWDNAAGPVLKLLDHHRRPSAEADWPRVWWVPGGALGLLPLHAAGHHTDPADDPCRRTVMDRVVSSYTPTVRALRHARRTSGGRVLSPDALTRSLIVAMPTTPGVPGLGRLPYVAAETELLRRHLPGAVLLREPDPTEPNVPATDLPTKAAVLRHLPDCPIAHFACHGASHPADPSRSLLLLHDHASDPFTVAGLAPVRLDHAQLAYLSACRTAAVSNAELLEESIHLTSAFQLAGFPHVVGTLWEIRDQTAAAVADAFYTHLRTPTGALDTGRSAWALHQAVRDLRDGRDLPGTLDRAKVPFLWAAYLHTGA